MATIEDAKTHWQEIQSNYKKDQGIRYAWTGDGLGTATSNFYYYDRKEYIWAREEDGRPFPVLNRGNVQPAINVPIILGYDDITPEFEQVLGVNWDALPSGTGGSAIYNIGAHHEQHEWRGGDEIFIDSRQFLPGVVTPTNPPSMQVKVKGFTYYTDRWYQFTEETSTDLTSEIPSSGSGKIVLVAFDLDDREVDYISGDEFAVGQQTWDSFLSGSVTDVFQVTPDPQPRHKPLGALFLSSSTTKLDWDLVTDNIFDTRLHFDRAERATAVGQIQISLDGSTFRPRIPITEKQVGLLFDGQSGHIIVG